MTANWKGEDELKTVFCLSLGRAGTLELYFPFFSFYHTVFTFFVPSTTPSLSHPCCLSLPPSLSETTSKWSPLANQPAAKICTTAFLFSLCLRACVIFQVFERVCPSWTFWVDPTQSNTHAHTPTLTAIKLQAEWFSRTPYTRLGGRKRCALVVVVCVECIHKLASLPLFQLYLQCFRRAVVFLPCTGIFCEEVYGNATSQQHSHCLIIQPLSDFNR